MSRIGNLIRSCFTIIKPEPALKMQPIARIEGKENHSAITCTPLLQIYGSLFCVDNHRIVFRDGDKNLKVLIPVKVIPRSKGGDFEAYKLGDGFAIRYKEHDYFFLAKYEVIEVYGMRIFDIKQKVIDATFYKDELWHTEDIEKEHV